MWHRACVANLRDTNEKGQNITFSNFVHGAPLCRMIKDRTATDTSRLSFLCLKSGLDCALR